MAMCPTCQTTELLVDQVITDETGLVTQYVYVCMNPKCLSYRKAFTLDNKDVESSIVVNT